MQQGRIFARLKSVNLFPRRIEPFHLSHGYFTSNRYGCLFLWFDLCLGVFVVENERLPEQLLRENGALPQVPSPALPFPIRLRYISYTR